jgi:hypothetical protein
MLLGGAVDRLAGFLGDRLGQFMNIFGVGILDSYFRDIERSVLAPYSTLP